MSRARKHVTNSVLSSDEVPESSDKIAKIIASPGGYLYEVDLQDGSRHGVIMPSRFRKLLWIKRGDYVMVNISEEVISKEETTGVTSGVHGQISQVLYPNNIKWLIKQQRWPHTFDHPFYKKNQKDNLLNKDEELIENNESDEDGIPDLNPNHRRMIQTSDDDDDDDDHDDASPQ